MNEDFPVRYILQLSINMGLRLGDKNQPRAVQGTSIATRCLFLKKKPPKNTQWFWFCWNFIDLANNRDGKQELRELIVRPNGTGFFVRLN